MSGGIELVLFDIGGVLGSNGWDREQRTAAVEHFGLDPEDFQYRHEEMVGALESGDISLIRCSIGKGIGVIATDTGRTVASSGAGGRSASGQTSET